MLKKLRKLSNDQVVTYRIGTYGKSSTIWQPWKTGNLYVRKEVNGRVVTICPRNEVCCEFSESDLNDDCLAGEGYLLQIKEIMSQP